MARFVAASTQYLLNSTLPFTALPATIACWVRSPTTTGSNNIFSWASSVDIYTFYRSTTNWQFYGDNSQAPNFGAVTANVWSFLLVRMVSTANMRLSSLSSTGGITHAQLTDGITFTPTQWAWGADYRAGPLTTFDGDIAETWITNTDVQPGGAQTEAPLLQQLAYRGPFSVPHVAQSLVDYRALSAAIDSTQDNPREVYSGGRYGRRTWTQSGGVSRSDKPPLLGGYRGPPGTRSALIVPV